MAFLLTEDEFAQAADAVGAGEVTPALHGFLRRLAGTVVGSGTVSPVLSASGHWGRDAAEDLLQDWLTERLLTGGLLRAFDNAATPRALSRYLERALRNYLVDKGRRRAAPRLLPRAHSILTEDDSYRCFAESGSWLDRSWGLARWEEGRAFDGTETDLVRAAYALGDFELVRFAPTSQRADPVISNPDLDRLLTGLFGELERTLTLRDIEHVLRARFGFAFEEPSVDLESVSEAPSAARPILDELLIEETAGEVLAEITERQLAIVRDRALESLNLDELAERHEISRSTADNELKRVGQAILRYLPSELAPEAVLDKLLDLTS